MPNAINVAPSGPLASLAARFAAPARPLAPLPLPVPADLRARLGVRGAWGVRTEGPRLVLLVFELDHGDRATGAERERELAAWADGTGLLHYPGTSITGAFLMVDGFPSAKPPSPEMEAARGEHRQAFLGEE